MDKRARLLLLTVLLLTIGPSQSRAADARFDLVGPRIDVRVTRNGETLPIAAVPNLQPGDKLWIHPDLPATQSVKYLLICVFLRGNTNPPPDNWFIRIETWDRKVREEGSFVTVPDEAQQALLFMAPETGGDFATLKSAIRGRPGAFVRASQDLTEAGFEQARIEKYLASIRRVPPSDPADLQKHSDLLARTLALKPNTDCFKRPVDTQFTCLTQTGSQVVLDDGHGQNIVNALSNGPGSDFIQQASYTQAFGAGVYSAYVGAVVDLIRIFSNLHTAQYQYIPAISFPQAEAMNLRLNAPPSFHNPKSVLVIALPSIQPAAPPPLRPADVHHVACLLKPAVVLPIEGAPLVFSADFAHDLVLHLNTPPGAPAEPDIPLVPDAYAGGLVLQRAPDHHTLLRDAQPDAHSDSPSDTSSLFAHPDLAHPDLARHDLTPKPDPLAPTPKPEPPAKPQPEPVTLTGTISGRWGFDPFVGPTVPLQQLPGQSWTIVSTPDTAPSELIAGHTARLFLSSTGTACVHTIAARPAGRTTDIPLTFTPDPRPDQPNLLAVTLPQDNDLKPGDLHLAIQQFDQPKPDQVSTRTFAEPAHITAVEVRAGDKTLRLKGSRLDQVAKLSLGDLVFTPEPSPEPTIPDTTTSIHLTLPPNAPTPPTHIDDHLLANITLRDGRTLSIPVIVSTPRPVLALLGKSVAPNPNSIISLANPDDLPLNSLLTFTLKSPTPFPRTGQVEIETVDSTLRTVLTLAPSGGLLLQDPHTVVATLDPLRSFGPSAFGALHLRAVFPLPNAATTDQLPPASDWLPLATIVRLPDMSQLQCPTDPTLPCTITGSNLFLLQAVSTDPAFADPVAIPDGYTGSTLSIPHPSAATLFLRLRDDPTPIDSAIFPLPPPLPHPRHTAPAPTPATPTTTALPATPPPTTPPSKQESPAVVPGPSPASTLPTPTPPAASPSAPGYGAAHRRSKLPAQSPATQTAESTSPSAD